MALEDIIRKERVIDTPKALDLAKFPEKWEERFLFHVSTNVSMADLTKKWGAILKNLSRKKSVTGLIYADTGYGKTSTALSLWHYVEEKGYVAVPPFAWDSMADMLIATHGWVCYRLKPKRPDLIPDLEAKYKSLIESSDEDLAMRISQSDNIPIEHARKSIQTMKAEGRISDSVSANRLIDYLRVTTSVLLQADYKGLLILPDEFELFTETNLDIAKNFSELKDFIFPLYQEESLPVGCVVLTYGTTFSKIQIREPYIFSRFNKPEGNLINLEEMYGKTENGRTFAHNLWEKLSIVCELSSEERKAIEPDVLLALGQFLSHPRTTQLISGPRSVVSTFRRAAIKYSETKEPYSIFDFCKDYLDSGKICFNQQEIDAGKAYTSIMNQPIIDSDDKKKVIELLCVFPDGVPPKIFQKHGIANQDRLDVVQGLLGTHVIRKIIGPTLTHYKDSLEPGDQLIELLKLLRSQYNPASAETHRAAVRSFVNYIIHEIFKESIGGSQTGWRGLKKMEGDLEPVFNMQLTGTSHREYPGRTLTVHVGTEDYQEIDDRYRYSQIFSSFILDNQHSDRNICEVREDGLYFRFDVQRAFDQSAVPTRINKLGDLFLPESITPSLLLSILDFFDKDTTESKIKQLKQEPQVDQLRYQIRNQLIGYFFSQVIKVNAVANDAELEEVPAGKDFVENALSVLISKQFPSYRALYLSNQWKKALTAYVQYLKNAQSLGVKQGLEPIKTISADVPAKFNVQRHTSFANTYYPDGVWRDLFQANEIDESGQIVNERVAIRNTQKRVAIYFKLHDMEKRILEMLENSNEKIVVDGKETRSLKLHQVFQSGKEVGYLDEEIEQLIEILKGRGLVDSLQQQGIDYIYLVETEINLAELKKKFESLKKLEEMANSKGFTFEWSSELSLSSVGQDFQKLGIEQNEVLKDSLRQKLRLIEDSLKTQCGTWVEMEKKAVETKCGEIGTFRSEVPKVLEQTTGHPITEFSVLLFYDIRSKIKKTYTDVAQLIDKMQNEIKGTLNKKIGIYMKKQTSEKAIEVAAELRDFRQVIDAKIVTLKEKCSEAKLLYGLFEKWRKLARQVEQIHQTMSDANNSDAVQNLIDRLSEEQQRIKRHLADRTLTIKKVLENYEYFANRIRKIKDEFDQISENRRDEFIKFKAEIQKKLGELVDNPEIMETYNPNDEEGCYQRVREKVVEKIQNFVIEPAMERISEINRDLMKPIEVFKVDEASRNKAISLKENVSALEDRISSVKSNLQTDRIEESLPELVKSLVAIRKEGQDVFESWGQIQDKLRSSEDKLSSRAKKLLDLIGTDSDKDFTQLIIELRQSGEGTFDDVPQIIESLEELYQRNWLNIKVSRTTGQ